MNLNQLKNKVIQNKIEVLKLCASAGQGHVSSAFSCAEIVTALYYELMNINPHNPEWEDRDRFVMSKNHASVILYPILKDLGFFDKEIDFDGNGSLFGAHSKIQIPGIDFAGGSLGIGLGVACGMAYSAKVRGQNHRVYVIVGDGECYEGAIWESLMFAGHNKLENLCIFIDRNMQDMTDFTEEVLRLESLNDKLVSFNFDVITIDGHDIDAIIRAVNTPSKANTPRCIICNTVKGNGISIMHNKKFKHGMAVLGEQLSAAIEELQGELTYAD